jgi:hypothetical protein
VVARGNGDDGGTPYEVYLAARSHYVHSEAIFRDPAYIRRLTDEYRRSHTVRPAPPIFVGEATSPTNIGHTYSHR